MFIDTLFISIYLLYQYVASDISNDQYIYILLFFAISIHRSGKLKTVISSLLPSLQKSVQQLACAMEDQRRHGRTTISDILPLMGDHIENIVRVSEFINILRLD